MGVAIGYSQKRMSDMSVELTKLAADMSSFYNVEQNDVAKSLESVFTGTTEPLRKYGLDLTNATLEEWAHKQGIDAKMKSMSQAEKTMLRYQYVMSQTGAAQGDFARTANSWANQTRMLAQSFQQLGSILGGVLINALKPIVSGLNVVMQKVISFAKVISDALGQIFGWTYEKGGGITNEAVDNADSMADSMDDVADATDKANKKQKEFNKQLAKFDELNNYTSNKGDKDKDKDKNGAGVDDLAGLGGGGKWKQQESILKKFKSDIKSLEQLGGYISEALSKAMEGIDWDSIYKKAEGFGTGLASFLNGLFTGSKGERLFKNLGKTIAGALNTAVHSALGFAKTFNWKSFGSNLASGVNSFFKNFDWKLTAEAFNTLANGILDSMIAAVQDINWKQIPEKIAELISGIDASGIGWRLGKLANSLANAFYQLVSNKETWILLGTKIADGINGFLEGMNEIDSKTGLSGWEALGKAISDAIIGIGNTIITALNGIDWEGIGNAIGTTLKNIDFIGISTTLAELLWSALKSGFEMLKGMFQEAPLETSLITAFGILKFTGLGSFVAGKISHTIAENIAKKLGVDIAEKAGVGTALKKGIGTHIATFFTTTLPAFFKDGLSAIKTFISNFGKAFGGIGLVIGGVATAVTNFIDMFKNGFQPIKEVLMVVGVALAGIGAVILGVPAGIAAAVGAVVAGIGTAVILIKDNWDDIVEFFRGLGEKISGFFSNAWENIKGVWNSVSSWFDTNVINPVQNAFKGIKEKVGGFFSGLWNGIKEIWGGVSTWFGENVIEPVVSIFTGIKTRVEQVFSGLWILVQAIWKVASGWFKTYVVDPIITAFQTVKDKVSGFFTNLWNGIKGIWGKVSNWFKTNVITPIQNAFSTMKDKVKTFFTNLWSGIKGVWNSVSSWFKNNVATPIQTAFQTVKTKVSGFFTSLWNGIKDVWDGVSGWFERKVIKPVKSVWKTATDAIGGFFASLWKGIKSGVAGAMNAVIGGIESAINWIVSGINGIIGGFNKIVTVAAKIVGADWSGVDKLKSVHLGRVKTYAEGGFPSTGQMFIAREAGPELVGNIGNRTAVVNNEQIVISVSQGVAKAIRESISPYLKRILTALTGQYVEIDMPITEGNADTDKKQEVSTPKTEIIDINSLNNEFDTMVSGWAGRINELASTVRDSIGQPLKEATEELFTLAGDKLNKTWSNAESLLREIPTIVGDEIISPISEKTNEVFEKIQEYVGNIGETSKEISDAFKESFNDMNSYYEEALNKMDSLSDGFFKSLSNNISSIQKKMDNLIRQMNDLEGRGGKLKKVKSSKGKVTLKAYEAGGFPEDGLFYANHSELVGTFSNGKTAVANNTQITQGIATAVSQANEEGNALMRQEINMLARQNELLYGILQKETGIRSSDLVRAVKREDDMFRKRTGRGIFAY
ncbi:MAG: hypothetical protein HFH72_08920 [Lachnospiraceae bacterium]|nr:hypothetical protein [Lachnospiraceae bacterium]